MTVYTFSNFLSLLRAPLVLLFIIDNPFYRCVAVVLAMITDVLDGYLARRWKMTSQIGAFLDPLTDKMFMIIAAVILIREGSLEVWQALAMISRDFAILFFGLYLSLKGKWSRFKFQSIWSGKITTTLQFFVLLAIIFHYPILPITYAVFIGLGLLALAELFSIGRRIAA